MAEPDPPPAEPPTPVAPAPVWPLFVAFAVFGALGLATDLLGLVGDPYGSGAWAARLQLIDAGLGLAYRVLLVMGAVELARRSTGRARLGAQLVLVAASVMLAVLVAHRVVPFVVKDDWETYRTVTDWLWRTTATCEIALAIGLVVAGWHVRTVRTLAVPLVLATIVAFPYRFIGELVYEAFQSGGFKTLLVARAVTAAAARILAAVLVWKAVPLVAAQTGGFARAARGFDHAAKSLFARLWLAAGGIMLFLSFALSDRPDPTLIKVFLYGLPIAVAVVGVWLGIGVVAAAQMNVSLGLRLRTLVAGAAILWTVGVQFWQVGAALQAVMGDHSFEGGREILEALTIAQPVIAAVALAMVGWSVYGLGQLSGNAELERSGTQAALMSLACNLGAVLLLYLARDARTANMAIVTMLMATALAIAALVSLARACRAAAAVCRARGLAEEAF